MVRFKIVQVVLEEEVIKELKEKTGEKTTKDALLKAVLHYLDCPEAGNEKGKFIANRKKRRLPPHLAKLIE
ncbi:hypothetical protein DRO97_08750 [Archaeoglobales archaeon]|nr:MAG: hypothetical protein DRO97_08750 [Archaeoglobales archaeon]